MSNEMYTKGEYLKNNPTWHIEDSHFKVDQILEMLRRNQLHPSSVCEVGCGAGEILNQLYSKMPDNVSFTGYEISPQAFELCEQKQKYRLQYHLKDILQDDNVFFDLLLLMDVIEHIEDYYGFLKKLHKKGDYKLFRIPLDLSAKTIFDGCTHILTERETVGHIHYFTKEIALAVLKDTGYEIVDYFFTPIITYLKSKSVKIKLKRFLINILFRFNPDATARIFGGYSLIVLTK
jgi:hypothetical protein